MKNAVLLDIEPKITPFQEIFGVSVKSGVLGLKSGVRVSKLSGSTGISSVDNNLCLC